VQALYSAEGGVVTVQSIADVDLAIDRNPNLSGRFPLVLIAVLAGGLGVATGRPGVAAALIVGVLAAGAAVVDERTGRIPNRLTLAALVTVLAAIPLVAVHERGLSSVASSVGIGLLLSGAPVLLAIWLVRPHLIGGGDWKLLAVLGAALGLISPLAAAFAAFVACSAQLVRLVLGRRRSIPFAPSLAVGYATALATIPLLTSATGGAL
jgi:prepilin signal peptidase PulO-like enzyme (type II secretory pathway)